MQRQGMSAEKHAIIKKERQIRNEDIFYRVANGESLVSVGESHNLSGSSAGSIPLNFIRKMIWHDEEKLKVVGLKHPWEISIKHLRENKDQYIDWFKKGIDSGVLIPKGTR